MVVALTNLLSSRGDWGSRYLVQAIGLHIGLVKYFDRSKEHV